MTPKMRKIPLVEKALLKNKEASCRDRFAIVLTCNGKRDFLICAKCGKGLG
jgi:hypothetical protein